MTRQGMFLLTVFTVFLMAGMDIFARFATSVLAANPPLYASFALFISACVLLIVAGPGPLGVRTLRDVYTWLYGILQVLFGIVEAYVFSLITATEGNLLFRFSIPLVLITGLIIFGRRPDRNDIILNLIVLAALGYIAYTLPENVRLIALLGVFVACIFYVLRNVVAEMHPTSNASEGVRDQCRVTGFVMLVTSFIFMGAYSLVGYVLDTSAPNHGFSSLPTLAAFTNTAVLITAALSGIFIIAPAKYLYFYLARKINSDNYTIIATFVPFFTLALEWPLGYLGILNTTTINFDDLLAGSIIIGAAIGMAIYRSKEKEK